MKNIKHPISDMQKNLSVKYITFAGILHTKVILFQLENYTTINNGM